MSVALSTRTRIAATTPPMIGPGFVLGLEEAAVGLVLLGGDNVDVLVLWFRQYIGYQRS